MSDADALDAAIDDVLAGRSPGVEPAEAAVVTALAATYRQAAPAGLGQSVARRVRRERDRRWIPARVAALVLAGAFASHAFGAFFLGEWVAEQVGGHYDVHTSNENGAAYMALAVLLVVAGLRRRWLEPAVAVAAPVGVFLGVTGSPELAESANAGSLHVVEGLAAVALIGSWWRARRYGSPVDDEGET